MSGIDSRTLATTHLTRTLVAVALLASLVVVQSGRNASAAGCAAGKSGRAASDAGMLVVSDEHTKKAPLEIRYDQPAGGIWMGEAGPLGPGGVRTPFRIASAARFADLHVRVEWPTPSVTDLDLYLFDQWGQRRAYSESWNVDLLDRTVPFSDASYGGEGFEYIEGVTIPSCRPYELATSSWHSAGEKVTVKLWLARSKRN